MQSIWPDSYGTLETSGADYDKTHEKEGSAQQEPSAIRNAHAGRLYRNTKFNPLEEGRQEGRADVTDDSWKDSYDSWKLAPPDDDRWEDGDDEPCEHDDYDIDTLSGYAFCWRCGDRRMLSDHEIAAQIAHEAAYARMEARWNRWRWWRDLKDKLRSLIPHRKHVIANDRKFRDK